MAITKKLVRIILHLFNLPSGHSITFERRLAGHLTLDKGVAVLFPHKFKS